MGSDHPLARAREQGRSGPLSATSRVNSPLQRTLHKARVIRDLDLLAGLAAQHVAAKRGGAAALDRRHHLELTEAQVTGLGLTPGRAVGAEDVRDLERGPRHGRSRVRRAAGGPPGPGARAGG